MSRPLLVADLFCGAGGTSTGARRAIEAAGRSMRLVAVNHWPVAISTHSANHPDAIHFCADLASVRPIEAVPGGKLDLLVASPTCTYHSRARGGRPIADQQRIDPWHLIPWLTELKVRCLLVENVPEFVKWGPVGPQSHRPVRRLQGTYFVRWLDTIRSLGFAVDWRILNAADFGDATTRARFFLIARSDGQSLRWPEPSHRDPDLALGGGLLTKPRLDWRPARNVIDWSIKGASIFDRKRPLAPKTLARIAAGIVRFGWPEPFLMVLRRHCVARAIDLPLPTMTAAAKHIALVQPFVLSPHASGAPRGVGLPLPTITTGGAANDMHPGCSRPGLVEPFLLSQGSTGAPRAVSAPVPTITGANRGELAFVRGACDHDILFRMLEPHELAAAMGFNDGAAPYVFSGTKTDQIRQIGNAVPVNTAAALVSALLGL